MERIFEWDSQKGATNLRKHGIQFEEAVLVFDDPFAVSVQDRTEHGEHRWQTIGMAGACVLVILVAHTVRFEDDEIEVIRVISARPADRKERRRYEQG